MEISVITTAITSVIVLFCLIYSVSIFIFARRMPEFAGLKWIGPAFMIYTVFFVLAIWQVYALLIIGNVLCYVGFLAFLKGVQCFLDRDMKLNHGIVLVVVFFQTVYVACAIIFPEHHTRVVLILQVLLFIYSVYAAITVRKHRPAHLRISYSLLFFAFLVLSIYALYRFLIPFIASGRQLIDFIEIVQIGMVALFLVHIVIASLAVVWLIAETQAHEIRKMSRRDPLTNALNRRAMREILEREFERTLRYSSPLSIIMLDLDHFKSVNDTYGHATGDAVLEEFSCRIKSRLRSSDLLFRYGGEEFVVVLIEAEPHEAEKIARELLAIVNSQPFVADLGLNITSSLGVASLTENIDKWETLVDQADRALYEAKESGRNRVVVCC